MNRPRFYVDTLGFLGDVGPPMFDDRTKKNARDSGVRLFVMTTTWPMQNWKVTIQMHRQTVESLNQHQDTFQIVRNTVDLQKALDKDRIGVILGMQDPGCIGDRFERVHQLYEEGIRVMQVAYQKKNLYGCGFLAESPGNGLTGTGRRFVEAVNHAGIILDLSHLSPATALDSIRLSEGPTIASHTTARAVYLHPRGSSDDVLTEMAGLPHTLVGVLAMTFFLDPAADGLVPFIDHMRHIAALVGPDKVAVGSDGPVGGFTDLAAARKIFQGKTQQMMDPNGVLRSRWPTHISEIFDDPRGFDRICQALSPYFSRKDIDGITGSNAWRFFSAHLPTAS
jgi:microsomal dipeptidase-like Zn-dependent dipeptidase